MIAHLCPFVFRNPSACYLRLNAVIAVNESA